MHLVVVIVFVALCALAIVSARRARADRRILGERVFSALCLVVFVLVNHELWLDRANFDIRTSLPLHVCDLTLPIVPLAIAFHWRPARVVLYYFGLLLS